MKLLIVLHDVLGFDVRMCDTTRIKFKQSVTLNENFSFLASRPKRPGIYVHCKTGCNKYLPQMYLLVC